MRTLFWILLLANVILFALMQRGGWSFGEQAYQAQPGLHEESIRLSVMPQSAAAKATVMPASAPVAAPAGPAAPAVAAVPAPDIAASSPAASAVISVPATPLLPANNKQNPRICLEWGDFSGADLKRATEALSALQLGEGKISQRQIEYKKGYWVYIPPLKSKTAATQKASQIRALGVKEYFIVQEAGAFRYAISLGVFKTQEAAQNHLRELRVKGISTARVGERASKLKTTMFVLNDVEASIEEKLTAAKKELPGGEVKRVPCALTK